MADGGDAVGAETAEPMSNGGDDVGAEALGALADGGGVVNVDATMADVDGADAARADAGDGADIDALCALFDDSGQKEQAGDDAAAGSDVDSLFGCLASQSSVVGDAVAPTPEKVDVEAAPTPEEDLPPTDLALPSGVEVVPFTMIAKFDVRCEVDMKKVAFALRHAEYNPRKHGSITIRLFEPRATALLRPSGVASITGPVEPDVLKACAKKVARLVQRAGHPEAKFAAFKINGIMAKANLGFPVRLDELAARWRRNALYEPELYCGCVFRTYRPRASYLVTAGGKVMLSGCRRLEDLREALRRIYPVLAEFQH
eukprot:CAMPEP_0170345276 /NCGR_PEP_ID=MMETSP0116_2-20130129/73863_1 /TAXON_ID=400756 /ORGANISM="Durinskia baltica, Strain CSIRO CS-38" /LENGTH=314 /DNA_ID=CAMNT_0010599029 /DNA_START=27 /DNA_END=971 /DNA_ORIENTATION=+